MCSMVLFSTLAFLPDLLGPRVSNGTLWRRVLKIYGTFWAQSAVYSTSQHCSLPFHELSVVVNLLLLLVHAHPPLQYSCAHACVHTYATYLGSHICAYVLVSEQFPSSQFDQGIYSVLNTIFSPFHSSKINFLDVLFLHYLIHLMTNTDTLACTKPRVTAMKTYFFYFNSVLFF